MALRILGREDYDDIRSIAMSILPLWRAKELVTDGTLQSFQIIGRAEQLVIRRIGTDWVSIKNGIAPVVYAGGDPISAQSLLRDAVIMLSCSFLCPLLKQIIPKTENGELVTVARDLDFTKLQTEYQKQANIALALIKPVVSVSGLTMSHPWPQPSDPDNPDNYQSVRPYFSRFNRFGRSIISS